MQLQEIAKELIKLNPLMRISGSVALNIQGIKTEREPHDLDMYLPFGETLVLLPGMIETESLLRYGPGDGGRMEYSYNEIMIDIFQPQKQEDTPKNIAASGCLYPAEILKYKMNYAFDNHETAKKHREDIIFILSNITDTTNDLDIPF